MPAAIGNMPREKILLTEGSSLTARETLTALASCGYEVHVLTCARLPLCLFSRWRSKIVRTVDANEQPLAYLRHVACLVEDEDYAAVLPTHEQAWLLAEGASLLPAEAPVAVASAEAFRRAQSKVRFAELLDELGLPQPAWRLLDEEGGHLPFPYWVKAEFGTAGRSTRRVADEAQMRAAAAELSSGGGRLMAQEEAPGSYGQVAGLFDHGRLAAVHTTVQAGVGAGNSAAARRSVDFPETRRHIEAVGERLRWHGPLTLDFLHVDGHPRYLECNPRMVEPGNAAVAGVNFPALLVELSSKGRLNDGLRVGAAGVETRSLQALLLGAAESSGTRRAVLRTLGRYVGGKGGAEVLTPVRADPPSLVPIAVVLARLLADPRSVAGIAAGAVRDYSVRPDAIDKLRRAVAAEDA